MIKNLEEFKVYNLAMNLGEEVWKIVAEWNYFEKDTIGKQLVRAGDSIAANLSEGLGRYHFKEVRNFSYYSRGSLFETKTWLTKAHKRNLISSSKYQQLINDLELTGKMLNSYINSVGFENGKVNEPEERIPKFQLPIPSSQFPVPQFPSPQFPTPKS